MRLQHTSVKPRTVLSLFSGCGGLDLGFVQAGYDLVLSIDNWEPAVRAHRRNNQLLGGLVWQKSLRLKDKELSLQDLPEVDIVLGGPPCQGFSFAGKQRLDDPRNQLYLDFLKIVDFIQPRCFVMENVRGIEAMALPDVVASFRQLGYDVTPQRVQATAFGVPQRRERVIIVGFRSDLGVKFVPPDAAIGGLFGGSRREASIFEALRDLPEPKPWTDDDDETGDTLSTEPSGHAFKPLSADAQRFVRHIPNGGYFRDAPMNLLPERLKKIARDPARYRSPRLFPKPDPFQPAQTVPADMNPSLGGVLAPDFLYIEDRPRPVDAKDYTVRGLYTAPMPSRRFTPREAARLQTFPDDFILEGSTSMLIRLIGNAVPVKLAKAYAERISDVLAQLDLSPGRRAKSR